MSFRFIVLLPNGIYFIPKRRPGTFRRIYVRHSFGDDSSLTINKQPLKPSADCSAPVLNHNPLSERFGFIGVESLLIYL